MFSRVRRDEFAVDEQFVSRRDDVILGFLQRGRVIPPAAEGEPAVIERDDGLSRSNDRAFGLSRRSRAKADGKFRGFDFGFHIQSLVAADVRRLILPSVEKVRAFLRRLLRIERLIFMAVKNNPRPGNFHPRFWRFA
jgi:hypothetical protein